MYQPAFGQAFWYLGYAHSSYVLSIHIGRKSSWVPTYVKVFYQIAGLHVCQISQDHDGSWLAFTSNRGWACILYHIDHRVPVGYHWWQIRLLAEGDRSGNHRTKGLQRWWDHHAPSF